MKNAKKVLAMVIVLALAISMAIPVSAATLNINNVSSDVNVDYDLWKMADLTHSENSYAYTAASGWEDFFKTNAATHFNYDEISKAVTKKDAYDPEAVAKLALAYAESKAVTAEGSSAVGSTTAKIEGLADGFYLVESSLGNALVLDTVVGTVNIDTKNTVPTIEKDIVDGENKVDIIDKEIGQEVNYSIVVTKQAGAANYVVVDTLSKGLTYKAGSAKISLNGATATTIDPGIADGDEGAKVLTFTINGEENVPDGKSIEITYTATVNADVKIDEANTNSAVIQYGNNTTYTSEPSVTSTYSWGFNLKKVIGGSTTPLEGATFSLYRVNPFDNTDAEPMTFTIDSDGAYRLDKDGNKTVFVDNGGSYRIVGLDSDTTYYIKEVDAPAGYNKLTRAESITITTDDTANTMTNVTSDKVIENNKGAELPSTGGTGTVIFIAVGSFLVLAMGVLLVVRKRMSKVVYTR